MPEARLLIVDDDHQLANLLKENLKEEGYGVTVGYDGTEAIGLTQSLRPDLLILDINMPGANGIDVLMHLRKNPATQAIPIIFITGLESKVLYPVIDRHQRVAYLKKPIDLEHLNSMTRQFLEDFPASPRASEPAAQSSFEELP